MAAASGEMQETIEARLSEALSPVHLEVINESHMHSGPAKESHFKVNTLYVAHSHVHVAGWQPRLLVLHS